MVYVAFVIDIFARKIVGWRIRPATKVEEAFCADMNNLVKVA